jgi:hypothetical protein
MAPSRRRRLHRAPLTTKMQDQLDKGKQTLDMMVKMSKVYESKQTQQDQPIK